MEVAAIENEYARITSESKDAWENEPSPGKFVGLPQGYTKLGISLGSYYLFNDRIRFFYSKLEQIASVDKALTLVPERSAHFTFLALAAHFWDHISELPQETKLLSDIVSRYFTKAEWRLNELRIVPGKNYLLLAGIPHEKTWRRRQEFAAGLLNSPWKKHIEQRHEYKGYSFPPVIWHTTLCRYQHEFLPQSVRELFRQFEAERFGELTLQAPELKAVNYDWSVSIPLTTL